MSASRLPASADRQRQPGQQQREPPGGGLLRRHSRSRRSALPREQDHEQRNEHAVPVAPDQCRCTPRSSQRSVGANKIAVTTSTPAAASGGRASVGPEEAAPAGVPRRMRAISNAPPPNTPSTSDGTNRAPPVRGLAASSSPTSDGKASCCRVGRGKRGLARPPIPAGPGPRARQIEEAGSARPRASVRATSARQRRAPTPSSSAQRASRVVGSGRAASSATSAAVLSVS